MLRFPAESRRAVGLPLMATVCVIVVLAGSSRSAAASGPAVLRPCVRARPRIYVPTSSQ